MKNIYKNKKGSTLVTLIIIFAILSILGTTLYSIAITNSKIGIMNSKLKRNFYFAESGLELAQDELIETIHIGIKEANKDANKILEVDLEAEREKENSPYITDDGNINDEYINRKQEEIFENSYYQFLDKKIGNSNNLIFFKILSEKLLKLSEDKSNKNESYDITAEYEKDDDKVKITSTYIKGQITQSVSAMYSLKKPNYSGLYSYESKITEIPNYHMLKNAISVDRNLNIDSSNFNINGDVFVNPQYNYKNLQEQKFGNININNSRKLSIIDGRVITKNVNTTDTLVKIEELYTSDDLNINGRINDININSYFGYGDGNIPGSSSAIVIDSMENNKIIVNKNLAILGTAFINTKPNYQTGESVSIKENYEIYTEKFSNENDTFDYYNPMVLLKTNNLDEKIERFYSESNKNHTKLNLGQSIKTPKNSLSKGILLNQGLAIEPNIPNGTQVQVIKEKADELIGTLSNGVIDRFKYIPNLVNVEFESETGKVNVVNGSIDIQNKSKFKGIMISSGSIAINSDLDFDGIMIAGGSIDINNKLNFKGILISGGEMAIYNDTNINGTVVSGYDLNFNSTSNVNVISNENYVFKLLSQNEKLTKNLFKEYDNIEKKKIIAYEKLVPYEEINYDINSIIELSEWKINYDK
ncbi:hypothetical protein [Senegalia massiliensis]|uniref:Type 4 fimbrial biogenesis protein PilX N-terminal domain-containing protein n=1 Tax=Senegalia massiliensis TaxID=1720316 RepID=A0A845QXE7_9CLOT|nr:hypothetical protein [Senegalia massiliensis]NBI06664.1 hypothetical protein [Senegalia massiliensis]